MAQQSMPISKGRAAYLRWAEFAGLYLGVPLALAFLLPPNAMFPVLFAMAVVAIWLLQRTKGFSWRELAANPALPGRVVVGFGGVVALISVALVLWLFPQNLLALPSGEPLLWLVIMALYPFFSALPQEVIFRVLFFRRYGALFASERIAMITNAAIFSFAHLMYWNPLVAAMTFIGGLVFSHAYARRGSLMLAWALHALAGQIIFTTGLGWLFYSGAVL